MYVLLFARHPLETNGKMRQEGLFVADIKLPERRTGSHCDTELTGKISLYKSAAIIPSQPIAFQGSQVPNRLSQITSPE